MTKDLSSTLKEQLALNYHIKEKSKEDSYYSRLTTILSSDLNFHQQSSRYASHNFHSFPAKFPPQLPSKFILGLTEPGGIVLDPMVGSGTTAVEAFLNGRKGIGFDIDPLAIMISRVKTTPLKEDRLAKIFRRIVKNARKEVQENQHDLEKQLNTQWDTKTKQFIDYWFARETQIELLALVQQILKIEDESYRTFFQLAFSAIIITKSGGVSLALDLAHTRPHKAKVVFSPNGELLYGSKFLTSGSPRLKVLTKKLRPAIEEFEKRCIQNISGLVNNSSRFIPTEINFGNAQKLPLEENSIDLIVTSPPYASNAIDYMRAHKFSLVWFGFPIEELSEQRRKYIGGEATTNYVFESLPESTSQTIQRISEIDEKRGNVLKRYFTEMSRTLKEMYRVLKPDKAAIVVVGSSTMRGMDTATHQCLAEIGEQIGFVVPHIGIRKLDRNKRMLPSGLKTDLNSQIQKRMHEEYVIGFYKPHH